MHVSCHTLKLPFYVNVNVKTFCTKASKTWKYKTISDLEASSDGNQPRDDNGFEDH